MSLDKLADTLTKMGVSNSEADRPKNFISTGYPPLDHEISGSYVGPYAGIPVGRIVEMYGPPAAGKTFLATNLMINAQRAGGIAIFMDHENAFNSEIGESFGLNTEFPNFIIDQPETFEKSVLKAVELITTIRESEAIPEEAPIVLIFDSLAAMVPNSKIDLKAEGFNMHDNTALARATSAALPALAHHVRVTNTVCVFLNQARTDLNVKYGDSTTSPGGDAPKFYSSVRLKLSKTKGDKGAQTLKAKVIKNKVWRPGGECGWELDFHDDGTIRVLTTLGTLQAAVECGAIERAGSYYVWTDGKKYHPGPLADKIEDEGLYPELLSLLEGRGRKQQGVVDE